ncbi:MAG: efflux RND transporter periplasmic adaptor subunit, partial [Gammaproteobacteria bacterium]|nr:efflux RND transporter periplasmic adaptor subunit [Gammaproteobacteria bacterium]
MKPGRRQWPVLWLVLVAICAGAAYFAGRRQQDGGETRRYRTEPVTRGEVFQTVSANGTLNPVVLVNVGTQISGRIQRLHADFNDQVREGQVLAELDPRLIQAQLRQSRANVASAQADLRLAESNAERTRAMVQRKFLAEAELDTAIKTADVARAALERARAQVAFEETNLLYTVIRSPVSGIVISRNVDVGQTVAATFQTPVLFQIAQDLTRMQIDTSLAEADVGGVRVGQAATFTVDAYPERVFKGVVRQIRMNPSVQQNVVTYDVVVTVDNTERLLLPGMTAVVTIRIAERQQVLRLPLAALRFRPSAG